jgi:hypothetical protein
MKSWDSMWISCGLNAIKMMKNPEKKLGPHFAVGIRERC